MNQHHKEQLCCRTQTRTILQESLAAIQNEVFNVK